MPEHQSTLQEEANLRWSFIDKVDDACVVVTERMEIVFVNGQARGLLQEHTFGKRCFEVIPVAEKDCAWECPTLRAVAEAKDLVYCEETVCTDGESSVCLGVIVIPLPTKPADASRALLMLRGKPADVTQEAYKTQLFRDAKQLRNHIEQHLLTT